MAQNRAAVSVEHPVPLLLHLEALVGTDVFQQRIEEVSKDLAATRETAEGTAAAIERYGGLNPSSPTHISSCGQELTISIIIIKHLKLILWDLKSQPIHPEVIPLSRHLLAASWPEKSDCDTWVLGFRFHPGLEAIGTLPVMVQRGWCIERGWRL